jgi:thiamine transport system ATP-binding protein
VREALADEVRDILLATGTTAIVVTHDRSEATAMSSRVLWVQDGRIES